MKKGNQILETLKERLEESRGDWKKISREENMDYTAITRIMQGVTRNPTIKQVQKIANYFGLNLK